MTRGPPHSADSCYYSPTPHLLAPPSPRPHLLLASQGRTPGTAATRPSWGIARRHGREEWAHRRGGTQA